MLDQPQALRSGETLNMERLSGYVQQHFAEQGLPALVGDLSVAQFRGGFSNLTYMLTVPTTEGEQEFVLRRPPVGAAIQSAHDMEREYRVLTALKPLYALVPAPTLYCADEAVIGAPFYLMERVQGVILRSAPPKDFTLTPAYMRRLSTILVDNLVDIHNIPPDHPTLQQLGKPTGYTERQVSGWAKRYEHARTDTIATMEQTARWLLDNIPAHTNAPTLLHNDYKYDNLVFSPDLTALRAVLDWEMATLGDPLMDVGTTLGYWAEAGDAPTLKAFGLTWMEGNLTRSDIVQRYAERTGRDVSRIVFYYAFGLFKIGVIAQQIYARFKQGLTTDERFAMLGAVVQTTGTMAQRAIQQGTIDA